MSHGRGGEPQSQVFYSLGNTGGASNSIAVKVTNGVVRNTQIGLL